MYLWDTTRTVLFQKPNMLSTNYYIARRDRVVIAYLYIIIIIIIIVL